MKMSELKTVSITNVKNAPKEQIMVNSKVPAPVESPSKRPGVFSEEESYSVDPDERDQALDMLEDYMSN